MSTETNAVPPSHETPPHDGALEADSPETDNPETDDVGVETPESEDAVAHMLPGIAGEMYKQCKTALRAFIRLRELSEDMRILSLNAELAAGRAGTAGVAVRALTQYTRQLVSQLNRVQEDMNTLQAETDAMVAPTAPSADKKDAGEHTAEVPAPSAQSAEDECPKDHLTNTMAEHAKQISVHAQTIRRISEQSNGIATNIAIEAAAAGRYEPEFRTVANTMKRYIADLRAMVDDSERAVKFVLETHERINARKAIH